MKRLLLILALILVPAAAQATTIQEVTSSGGIRAWLVEDHKLPLIAMQFAFRGGVEQDPVQLQGLAHLTMDALTEGAGPYDAAAFQQQLSDRSITLGFSAGRDALYGHLKALSADRATAFDLLQLALSQPQFDAADIERLRAAQLGSLKHQLASPDWQARYALYSQVFAGHPYGQRSLGSVQTLSAITRDDLQRFAADHLAQDNLVISVAGDMTPAELAAALDHVFGGLPRQATLAPVADVTWPAQPAMLLVPRNGTQTSILFAMPGPLRLDPDWYAAETANYALGGGGFQSRLMHDVREDKGLTYGIDTSLSGMDHAGALVGQASTDNDKTGQAWQIVLATMHRFYDGGMTDDETTAAKNYLTGSLPLEMTSTDKIAGLLVEIQLDRLGIDYLDRRDELINSVTAADLTRTIRRWFNPDGLTAAFVGQPAGINPTVTRDLVKD